MSQLTGTHAVAFAGGVQEVRRLEKLRAKRAFEASLPPIDDVERLPERQAMIEAWEVQEWVEREEEIKGLQEERLGLLVQALQVRIMMTVFRLKPAGHIVRCTGVF